MRDQHIEGDEQGYPTRGGIQLAGTLITGTNTKMLTLSDEKEEGPWYIEHQRSTCHEVRGGKPYILYHDPRCVC